MALIYLLTGLVLGAAIVRRIPFPLYLFESVALTLVLGLFGWTWLAFLAALVLPYDIAYPIVVTVSLIAALVLWPGGNKPEARELEGGTRAWWVWGVATVATAIPIVLLFWSHSLTSDAEGLWTAGPSWADYGVHASIINHINAANSLPMELPVASGEKLTYPFLFDFLSSNYLQGGMSLHASLFWPGVLYALAICQLLISVGLRLFERISVGVAGMALALAIGSAAGAWTAWGDWRESGKGFFDFLGALPIDYSQVPDAHANVTNLLVDSLLPQRGILFGMGIGLTVLIFLHASREREQTALLWPAAILIGLMPMAHAHTFIVCMAWLATLTAEAAWRTRKVPVAFLWPLGTALLLALPQQIWQQLANGRGTGGRFRLWWMWEEGQSLPGYWWANFGLFGLLLIVTPIVLRRNRQLIWLLPMLVIFVITQLYAFQPFEYDNTKLITWVYVIAGFYLAFLASELVRRHRAWLVAVVPAALLIFTPGVLAITREFQLRSQFASPPDLELATWVKANTAPDAVFASADKPNNPVATIAGRSVLLGYRGWLYSYNIPYTEREAAVKAGLTGKFDDPALRESGADYMLVASAEDPSWGVDEAALAKHQPVWSNEFWRVYKLP